MTWTFKLDALVIEEPAGFNDMVLSVKRDAAWHGIFFEASSSSLRFYGEAADYLRNKKIQEGFAADVTFTAESDCDGVIEIFSGKVDFRQYSESCGTSCIVSVPIEQTGCVMTMRNRYDHKVDLTNQLAHDGITLIPDYIGLNFIMPFPAQAFLAAVEGVVGDENSDTEIIDLDTLIPAGAENWNIRPTYYIPIQETLATSQLIPAEFVAIDGGLISPILLLEENPECFDGIYDYSVRIKGSYNYSYPEIATGSITSIKLRVCRGEYPGSLVDLHAVFLPHSDKAAIGTFDYTFSGQINLAQGEGFYVFYEHVSDNGVLSNTWIVNGELKFDYRTRVIISAEKLCPPVNAKVSMIHEAASRVVESITDRCLTVKSDYYGRTDSEPYQALADGCGSLRVITSGLRLRNAEGLNHFLSLKELFEGLRGIDNIGMGLEGTDILRIEPVEFFYKANEKIMDMPFIPEGEFELQENKAYSIVKIGYAKWEIEAVNGLDEFNSNKEFITTLKSVNNTLDAVSKFVAGGYAIEHTRQQQYAESGAADTTYDNETFIVCVVRGGTYSYTAEQGNIENASGLYSPATAYNWRIRPMYNLMRWWKMIAQSYASLSSTVSKLMFSAGTGNIKAQGELPTYDPCRVEAAIKAENDELFRSDMITEHSLPVLKPETLKFTYPLTLEEYLNIKANPYGWINAQCGDGSYVKGYIQNINYRIANGNADITLILKWGTD